MHRLTRINMNRVHPVVSSYLWDDARAVANGLVANGHVVLLVLVCIAVSYMGRDLLGLAELIDQPEQPQLVEKIEVERDEPWEAVQQASDERIDMHYRCTFTEYRRANEAACAALNRHVADAIRRDIGSEGLP